MDPFKAWIIAWLACLTFSGIVTAGFIYKALFRHAGAIDDHEWRLRNLESRPASHDDKPEGVYDEV